MLFYIRIPKTASTSMLHILSCHYRFHETYMWNNDKDINHFNSLSLVEKKTLPKPHKCKNIKLVTGKHFGFGLHKLYSGKHNYITMLRNPVDRVISDYYYFKHLGKGYEKYCGKSLEEHIERYPCNLQTTMLAGERSLGMLDIAQQNIRKHFLFVGFTEFFETSIALLNISMGWSPTAYQNYNITPNKPQETRIDANIINKFKQRNNLDIELYESQLTLFKKKTNLLNSEITKIITKTDQLNANFSMQLENMLKPKIFTRIPSLKKVGFYGASGGFIKEYDRLKKSIPPQCKVAIFDNDKEKWGQQLLGFPIQNPKEIKKFNPDCIIITSHMFQTIIQDINRYQDQADCQFEIALAPHLNGM